MKKLSLTLTLTVAISISACSTLPTSGPSQSAVMNMQQTDSNQIPEVNVIELDNQTVQRLYQTQKAQQFSGLAGTLGGGEQNGTVKVGDVLQISIWEAPPAVLFGGTFGDEGQGSANLTKLPEQMVNKNGTINVPFVGNIAVAGKTPENIQSQIISVLRRKANQPQVMVRLVNNNATDVTVVRQGNAVRMPLTANNERVLDAVAAVGGTQENIDDITIQLTRDNQVRTLAYETLISDPSQNITLRSGDVVSLRNNPYSFTALGAVGNNQQLRFSTKGITLAEAIGKMGGLIDTRSDPRGVFIFRYIPFEQLTTTQQDTWKSRGYNIGMDVPSVYRVNLLDPKAMFLAQRFPINDKDIVYVSNAPLAEFQKFLRMIFSLVTPVTSTTNSVRSF
ncbi:polysaccharide biosynthesis/export family protein [Pasteurella bettyae]|uniref:Capsule polysaccharide export outer membrane protein CtrA n=1 Tax=Pasteurella bettyae CCUG 2042 TaxID=1095749 RepID=I3DAS2_9PAST|nr:polysaccharide biosynthesis/export family protein [Pasteurella bettyae]EIJ68815.1 capsule polysaccharide export outer membrane protein CtrA [Pasteurella bettyae CCUG 2042]